MQTISLELKMYTGIAVIGQDLTFQRVLSEDQYLFAAYMSALQPVINAIAEQGGRPTRGWRELMDDMTRGQAEKINISTLSALDERNEALKMINELKTHLGTQLTAAYASGFIRFTEVHKISLARDRDPREILRNASLQVLEFIINDNSEGIFSSNLRMLSKLVGMTRAEQNAISIATLQTVDPAANIFFRYIEHAIPGRSDLMDHLSATSVLDQGGVYESLSTPTEAFLESRKALDIKTSKPLAFGLVKYNQSSRRFMAMSDFWISVLFTEHESIGELCDMLLVIASEKDSAAGALARMDDKDCDLITKLIDVVKNDPGSAKGCNLLCYGSRRFDKRTVILESVKNKVDFTFELKQKGAKDGDLPSITWVAQARLAEMHKKSGETFALLINNAENVLSRSLRKNSFMYELFGSDLDQGDKSSHQELDSDEHLLTESPTLTFWMTDNISSLAEEAVGRFFAHIEVKGGTRADRKAEVQKIANELKLSPELVQTLAKYTELGSHQVRSAATLTKLLGETGEAGERRILTAVEASQKALSRTKTEEIRESVTKYDLSLLNLSGKFGVEKIVKSMQKRPQGTLCFYGLPGTGKTQLAEHIALALDKPLLIKRASDILSKWVGEAEQNIKKMFEEGMDEDAIVLLDEADSFLRDRALAKQSWEVTMVNELLTRMERFPGVFICATNLFEQLDAAALRRFTFKLQFHSLNEQQRQRMFENETGIKVSDIDDPLYLKLHGIKYLTPGDFATVKRQANLLDETLTPNSWLEQLNEESKAKMTGIQAMGLSKEESFLQEQASRGRKGS